MFQSAQSYLCPAFPVAVRFLDVEPDVLAREAAHEAGFVPHPPSTAWHSYLLRTLPKPERGELRAVA